MACRASVSARPSSVSSRMPCGSRLMPTPSGWISGAVSNTRADTPAWCRLSAKVSPPTPPPTISTSGCSLTDCRSLGRYPALGDDLGPAPAIARHDLAQSRRRRGRRDQALGAESLAGFVRTQDRDDLLVEPRNDVGRRVL